MSGESERSCSDSSPEKFYGIVPMGYDARTELNRRRKPVRGITQIVVWALCDVESPQVIEDINPRQIPHLSAMLDTRWWTWDGDGMPHRCHGPDVPFAPMSADRIGRADDFAGYSFEDMVTWHDRIEYGDELPSDNAGLDSPDDDMPIMH